MSRKLAKYKLKEGVSIAGLSVALRVALRHAGWIWEELGQTLIITSGTEYPEAHGAGSYHAHGYAIDFRVYYFEDGGTEAAEALQLALGDKFTVILHKGHHIHVHFKA